MQRRTLTNTFVALSITALSVLGAHAFADGVPLHDGLLSYWPLDEGAGIVAGDASPGGSIIDNGELRDGPTWLSGKFGAGLGFAGAENVLIPNSADMDINSNAVSLSTWVKLDKMPSDIAGSFAGIYDSQPDNYVLYLDKNSNELRFKVTDANGASTSAHPGVPASMLDTTSWHHVMGVYDGSVGSVKIYWDGAQVDLASLPTTVGTVRPGQVAGLGAQTTTDAPHTASNFYEGGIADLAIWNRPLGVAEAEYLFNSGAGSTVGGANPSIAAVAPLSPTAPTAQPVIHYTFDGDLTNQGSGGSALDGVFHDGPAMAGPQYTGAGSSQGLNFSSNPEATNSVDNEGADAGQYLSVDYTLPEQGSIALQFSSEASFNFQSLWGNSVHANAWEAWVYGNERLSARANNASNAANLDYLLTLVGGVGEEHDIVFTWERDGDQLESKLYIDGELREIAAESWLDPGGVFYLGGGPGNHLSRGVFGDLRIYDVALAAGEVLYLSRVPEPNALAIGLLWLTAMGSRRRRATA
ncbi:hypothetical protein Pla123a_11180 [Posidoniimonas polymericola]|uniref:LamG-like jellyroll fold domain-containing protein n=1 Tax=Posidoniimonas polymericola TaxID=2528002 RepID=A0A5C5YUV3_9BACT|nr:LamG domain-containing protein [Posidoniimonas polymericola]TWT78327.1 hypothetical protein Pla123a_11180 [Posidoniimonas polymericola]